MARKCTEKRKQKFPERGRFNKVTGKKTSLLSEDIISVNTSNVWRRLMDQNGDAFEEKISPYRIRKKPQGKYFRIKSYWRKDQPRNEITVKIIEPEGTLPIYLLLYSLIVRARPMLANELTILQQVSIRSGRADDSSRVHCPST